MFNWRRSKIAITEQQRDEWPEFTDNLVTQPENLQRPKILSRLTLDDARFGPKTEEDILAAARSIA